MLLEKLTFLLSLSCFVFLNYAPSLEVVLPFLSVSLSLMIVYFSTICVL